jgi:hypothetical protein
VDNVGDAGYRGMCWLLHNDPLACLFVHELVREMGKRGELCGSGDHDRDPRDNFAKGEDFEVMDWRVRMWHSREDGLPSLSRVLH